MKASYDKISAAYTAMVKTDPQKKYVQYPSALSLLGNINGLSILDVGCGSGAFARELASQGASVVAYDISNEQIANAKKDPGISESKIEFIVSGPKDFRVEKKFDKAVSTLVLHYAHNAKHLKQFFSSTCDALKSDGKFVCILANPEFKRIGDNLYNRCFRKLNNGRMVVDFLDRNKNVSCSAEYSDFSRMDYEKAALISGFKKFKWIKLKVSEIGKEEMGEEYWSGFEKDCLYVGFVAYK